ncbi:MAG: alpha/beta hydrolase-fold protein, partial [Candidatus Aminicenantes bacterium]|nr:alpha/beta hydrolase-fold protein [Candidatus Aminicenantes bacterium]
FEEHPQARYPLMIYHGHHHRTFYTPVGFLETPPEPGLTGYDKTYQDMSYQFYQDWTGADFPRMIIVTIQHANPYYDDSYAVNSANVGPYGDAITYELIPYIEEKYRGIGEGWARVLYGGSTGGWEALAVQIFYPDQYNGTWAFCPDPIDFRAYQVVNIYEHENAYYMDSQWKRTPRPGQRNYLGEISATIEETSHHELVLGTNGRSGGQWDIWQAVFGPVGEDGCPKPIWDKRTGKIDHSVSEYWRENYDLHYILERDWAKLGPKLAGKLHIYVGDMDNFHLNNAVYLMEEFLEGTKNPYYDGVVEYGDRFEHCWSGDHNNPNSIQRLTINQRFAPQMVEHILKTAPPGADITSWRY